MFDDPKQASFAEIDAAESAALDAVEASFAYERFLDTEAQLNELNRLRSQDTWAAFPLGWEEK